MLIKPLIKIAFLRREFNVKFLKFQVWSFRNLKKNFFEKNSISFFSTSINENIQNKTNENKIDKVNLSYTKPQNSKLETDALQLIHEIVEKWNECGKKFILPWNDEEAMALIIKPFKTLLNEGVQKSFLFDACIKREELLRAFTRHSEQLIETINIIMECTGLTYENTLRFIANYSDKILNLTPQSIENCFFVFLSRGIVAGKQMAQLLLNHPEIIFASNAQKMDMTLETISSFFPRKELLTLLITSPQISLQNSESLLERYEYIYYHMAIEPEEFCECIRWHELDLNEIMMRHDFLRRTGKYSLPDPKRPQIKMENPPMFKIFDTDDHEFSTQVAGVRTDEWILFKEVYEKENIEKNMEVPYPKIKPSLRKSYERKRMSQDLEQKNFFDDENF